jgi:hypothetical protein
MNYTCQQTALANPPTDSPTCALYAFSNSFAILQKCCNNGPVGNFSIAGFPNCFQYCNITDPSLSYNTALQCMQDELLHTSGGEFDCGPGLNKTSTHSIAPGLQKPGLRWMLLAAAVASAIVGAEMGM